MRKDALTESVVLQSRWFGTVFARDVTRCIVLNSSLPVSTSATAKLWARSCRPVTSILLITSYRTFLRTFKGVWCSGRSSVDSQRQPAASSTAILKSTIQIVIPRQLPTSFVLVTLLSLVLVAVVVPARNSSESSSLMLTMIMKCSSSRNIHNQSTRFLIPMMLHGCRNLTFKQMK